MLPDVNAIRATANSSEGVMMERIVYLDSGAIPAVVRRPVFEHEWVEYPATRPEDVKARLEGATIAITHRVFLKGEDLPPTLRLIAVGSTGYERIDLAACWARGVHVCNVRDWSVSVPEHVFALALALRRNLLAYHSAVRSGAWSSSPDFSLVAEPMSHTLRGNTLGIIGFGTLGRSVAQIGRAFGMEVLVAERKEAAVPRPARVPFRRVLQRSDLLAVLCPLTPQTHCLIGAEELALMKADALLINCARGGIVDELALAEALAEGRIGGAGIDSLETEPPSPDNPLLKLKLDNLIVTPHVAWASRESLANLVELLIQNIEAFVLGEPRNLVA
jgi:glycerate dehydrogenase